MREFSKSAWDVTTKKPWSTPKVEPVIPTAEFVARLKQKYGASPAIDRIAGTIQTKTDL
jgi:hypothetical protein